MNERRKNTPTAYAVAAALCDSAMEYTAQNLLIQAVIGPATGEVKVAAMVMIHTHLNTLAYMGLDQHGRVTEDELMNYVFWGVHIDPDFRAAQLAASPVVKPPSTVEFMLTQAVDAVRMLWMSGMQIDERAHPAFAALINLRVMRHLNRVVERWAREAVAVQFERDAMADQLARREFGVTRPIDYGIGYQRGYAQMRADLYQAGWDLLLEAQQRALVLEEHGVLPESRF